MRTASKPPQERPSDRDVKAFLEVNRIPDYTLREFLSKRGIIPTPDEDRSNLETAIAQHPLSWKDVVELLEIANKTTRGAQKTRLQISKPILPSYLRDNLKKIEETMKRKDPSINISVNLDGKKTTVVVTFEKVENANKIQASTITTINLEMKEIEGITEIEGDSHPKTSEIVKLLKGLHADKTELSKYNISQFSKPSTRTFVFVEICKRIQGFKVSKCFKVQMATLTGETPKRREKISREGPDIDVDKHAKTLGEQGFFIYEANYLLSPTEANTEEKDSQVEIKLSFSNDGINLSWEFLREFPRKENPEYDSEEERFLAKGTKEVDPLLKERLKKKIIQATETAIQMGKNLEGSVRAEEKRLGKKRPTCA